MRLPHLSLAIVLLIPCSGCLHRSPGTLYESSTDPLTSEQATLRDEMRADVETLSVDIGPRNAAQSIPPVLAAEEWITGELRAIGVEPRRDPVAMGEVTVANVEATFTGTTRPDEIIVIGGHYDTVFASPGANDNASGVAMLLALARRLHDAPLDRTVRVVFFVNEEYPFSFGHQMGSRVYAEGCRARGDEIVAMLSVDSVGFFSSEPGSQRYPWYVLGFPSRGNFVAFAANMDNRPLLDRLVELFQEHSRFPSIGVATDSKNASRSDHAPFWWQGYPAVSLTDTSLYRDPDYHSPHDTIDNLAFDEMARLADGLIRTVVAMAGAGTELPPAP